MPRRSSILMFVSFLVASHASAAEIGSAPPELDSDAEMVKHVLKYDGAVGYVSGTAIIAGCRVLTVR